MRAGHDASQVSERRSPSVSQPVRGWEGPAVSACFCSEVLDSGAALRSSWGLLLCIFLLTALIPQGHRKSWSLSDSNTAQVTMVAHTGGPCTPVCYFMSPISPNGGLDLNLESFLRCVAHLFQTQGCDCIFIARKYHKSAPDTNYVPFLAFVASCLNQHPWPGAGKCISVLTRKKVGFVININEPHWPLDFCACALDEKLMAVYSGKYRLSKNCQIPHASSRVSSSPFTLCTHRRKSN